MRRGRKYEFPRFFREMRAVYPDVCSKHVGVVCKKIIFGTTRYLTRLQTAQRTAVRALTNSDSICITEQNLLAHCASLPLRYLVVDQQLSRVVLASLTRDAAEAARQIYQEQLRPPRTPRFAVHTMRAAPIFLEQPVRVYLHTYDVARNLAIRIPIPHRFEGKLDAFELHRPESS